MAISMSDVIKDHAHLGLERSFIYYLESQGFIQPQKERTGKVERRKFTPEDVEKITRIWEYVRKYGMTPRKANERVQEELSKGYSLFDAPEDSSKESFIAFMLMRAELGKVYQTLDTISRFKEIQEAAVIFGDWDVIIRLAIDDLSSLHRFFAVKIRSIRQISKVKTFIAIDPRNSDLCWSDFSRHDGITDHDRDYTVAYIFIETRDDGTSIIRDILCENKEVISAASVYGEVNIIAKVAVQGGLMHLNSFIDQTLWNQPAVVRTNTFPVLDRQKGYLPLEAPEYHRREKN